ncbi:MAG: site-specific integrase [Ruminococcus sp.]|nr:site-specific integrase [Ruminococcus sp.]
MTVPKKNSDKQKNDFYSPEEVKKLLEAVEDDRMKPVVYLGLVGLRRSEMLALTWNDVDFANCTINVDKNLVVINGKMSIGRCKTRSSVRKITVPKSVMNKLAECRQSQQLEKMAQIGKYQDNGLVVCKLNGSYIIPASLSSMFPTMLKKYGLRKIRIHDLRHTYCTLGINYYNIPATVIAKQAGHSSPRVTMDSYSHANEELQRESSDIFEDRLFGDINQKLG